MSYPKTDTWTVAIPSLSAGSYTTGQTLAAANDLLVKIGVLED